MQGNQVSIVINQMDKLFIFMSSGPLSSKQYLSWRSFSTMANYGTENKLLCRHFHINNFLYRRPTSTFFFSLLPAVLFSSSFLVKKKINYTIDCSNRFSLDDKKPNANLITAINLRSAKRLTYLAENKDISYRDIIRNTLTLSSLLPLILDFAVHES